ncbi:ABC transporter permease [Leeia sp. TBRC 13508]|uniref:ABC transporter permease n=1 Tax=Leeia speluncae TaxID=2884804 RepID=A0ABS8DBN7_9NEIS|nr:ABC transporter permease [Leeia speluncae]MCB6185043.1 ABC transporter permease [Leeia speluncae]
MSITHTLNFSEEKRSAFIRLLVPILIVGLVIFFTILAPSFLTLANWKSLLLNNFSILAITAISMTFVVSTGGIDLSVGTALDFSGLALVLALNAGYAPEIAIISALVAGLLAGAFNAFLTGVLRITPFLATLGTLFIGTSTQQLLSNGGQPIYINHEAQIQTVSATLLGIPLPITIAAIVAIIASIVLGKTIYGRLLTATGIQPAVVRYSGLSPRWIGGSVFLVAALLASIAGILLTTTVSSYVPLSGNSFLLNSIGATFIGTTLARSGRANVPGTLAGVLFLNIVANGLLLIGWNFFWQQVATGAFILIVLAISFGLRKSN